MNKNILVVAEHFRGHLSDITFELLGKGRELAQALGGKLALVLMGHEIASFVSEVGAADVVYLADRPDLREFTPEGYAAVVRFAVGQASPRLVLLGSTSVGLDLLSFLSAQLNVPCLDNCTRLEAREAKLVAISQIYGGKLYAEAILPGETGLVAVVPGMFPTEVGKLSGQPEIQRFPYVGALPEPRMTFRKLIEPPAGDVDITKVPLLVAVGRGIQSADNLPLAEALAQALGGAVCGSRPVIDQGWLPLTRQVGKSGMTVKPKLYLALGISGAPEHQEGMKGAELIIAINTDPRAPIFNVAHFGAVADVFDVIPALTEEIQRRQSPRAA